MSVDVMTAIDLRLGKECWVEIRPTRVAPGSTSTPHSSLTAYPDSRQTHPVLLECSTVLTRLGHIQPCLRYGAYAPNEDTKAVVSQHKT